MKILLYLSRILIMTLRSLEKKPPAPRIQEPGEMSTPFEGLSKGGWVNSVNGRGLPLAPSGHCQ